MSLIPIQPEKRKHYEILRTWKRKSADISAPARHLLYSKIQFSQVIPFLAKEFHVIGVDYDGFDDKETEFTDMITITQKIENFIQKQFHGKIDIAYGSSLGGSSVSLLIQRRNIHIDHVVIGSSDFDQNGKLSAWLKTQIVSTLMSPILKSDAIVFSVRTAD